MTQKEIKKEIQNIAKQIIEKYGPQKIILFGSAAKKKLNKDSDLDFFIVKEDVPNLGRERARQLRRLIQKNIAADFIIYKPMEFDKWYKMGDPFLNDIVKDGEILYGE